MLRAWSVGISLGCRLIVSVTSERSAVAEPVDIHRKTIRSETRYRLETIVKS